MNSISFHTYFELLALSALWCCGFFSITRKGKLFDFIPPLFDKMHDKIKDPITHCVTCIASLHSLFIYGIYVLYWHLPFNFLTWILIAIPTAYLNNLLWTLYLALVKYVTNEKEKKEEG